MEIPSPVEHRRPFRETPAEKLGREIAAFGVKLFRTASLTAILTPVLLLAFLTFDLPVRNFNVVFDNPILKPSLWLSQGTLIITMMLPMVLLIARRFGGDEASASVTASWGVAAVMTFAGLSAIAPTLETGDMPAMRFIIAFVASTMLGQYLAIGVYDITRGGGPWWRAPLVSCLVGFGVQSVIYFPSAYWKSTEPWLSWMMFDLVVKAAISALFLPVYWMLLKPLRPRGGYGGR